MNLRLRCYLSKVKVRHVTFVPFFCLLVYTIFYHGTRPAEINLVLPSMTFQQVVNLNLSQDDPWLVKYVRESEELIAPPASSEEPYRLADPNREDPSEGKISVLLEYIFNEKQGGTFLEVGAFDGESHSTTLVLERFSNWKGVLVEPLPNQQADIIKKKRKVPLIRACLSVEPRAMQVDFLDTGNMLGRMRDYNTTLDDKLFYYCPGIGTVVLNRTLTDESLKNLKNKRCVQDSTDYPILKMNCLPLYTVLLATNLTKLDFLSIDTEGSEYGILRTLPFDKVDIKFVRVEITALDPDTKEKLKTLMSDAGYTKLRKYRDYVFDEDSEELYFLKERNFLLNWLFP